MSFDRASAPDRELESTAWPRGPHAGAADSREHVFTFEIGIVFEQSRHSGCSIFGSPLRAIAMK